MCLAIPGRIVSLAGQEPLLRTGRVDFGGIVKEVSLAFVPDAAMGQFVLVHAGVAISVLDAEAANETLQLIDQLGEPAGADGTES